jgi:para-nitrobenzyl esterase
MSRKAPSLGLIISVASIAVLGALSPAGAHGNNKHGNNKPGHHQPGHHQPIPPVVSTNSGLLQGIQSGPVVQFLGVPYAKPPVGKLRWANPEPPTPWKGVRLATKYGNYCAQLKSLGDFAAAGTDEDCLYLNVYAPKSVKRGARLPVMIWLHGGGSAGMGNGYDGSTLANEQNVIVITLNSRMGALGSLVHPAFDGGGSSTHYTLRDQILAMKWVRDNITNFGGNPQNVTLFGESIGGVHVQMHVISPLAKGLFHRALYQSGPSRYFNRLIPLSEAQERGRQFATAVGCPDQTAACLRNVPVSTILANGSGAPALPIQDGYLIKESVYDAMRSGRFNRVPIMDVTNRDEYRLFVAFTEISTGHAVTAAEYPDKLTASFGANASRVLAAYPLNAFDSPSGALAAAQGDNAYPCQVRSYDVDASKYVPVYAFEFNDPNAPGILPPVSFPLLSTHTHEMQYIFPGWKGVYEGTVPALTAKQQKLAREMRGIWAQFARTGSLPYPRVKKGSDQVTSLEIPKIRTITNFNTVHKCSVWNSIRGWTPN